jgi:hypothetical protein
MQHKKNYIAWAVDYHDFPEHGELLEQLHFLLRYGILAPSSHNSQPWQFKIVGDVIYLLNSADRQLPWGDPDGRLRHIALGAALRNILVAADYFGFDATYDLLPAEIPSAVAVVRVIKQRTVRVGNNHLLTVISKRSTNRNHYSLTMPPPAFFEAVRLKNTSSIHAVVLPMAQYGEKIADVVGEGIMSAMSKTGFRAEMSKYKKSNLTKSFVGMPGFDMGFSTLMSLLLPSIIRFLPIAPLVKKKDGTLLKKHTPAVVVISTATDEPRAWLEAGLQYGELILVAEQLSLVTHFMAAAVVVGDCYKKLQAVTGSNFRPQVFFRVGFTPNTIPHSPRRTHEHCLTTV